LGELPPLSGRLAFCVCMLFSRLPINIGVLCAFILHFVFACYFPDYPSTSGVCVLSFCICVSSIQTFAVCRIEVTILVPGGSASRSGLVQVGDCLQSIDGVMIRSVPQAKSLIVGDVGTTVTLMLLKKVPNPNVWNVFAPRERVESVSLQREVLQVMYCIQQLAICGYTLLQSLSYISYL
jgi:hypothetical protein